LAHVLPKAQYSAYVIVTTTIILLTTLSALGAPPILARVVRQMVYSERSQDTWRIFLCCQRLVFCGSCLVAGCFVVASRFLGDEAKWQALRDYPFLIAGWFSLSALCLISAWALQAMDSYHVAVFVGARSGGVINNVAFFLVACWLWKTGQPDLRALFLTPVVIQGLVLVAAQVAIWRRLVRLRAVPAGDVHPPVDTDGGRFDYGIGWFLRECWPTLAARLLAVAIVELDVLVVGSFCSDEALADYGAAKWLVRFLAAAFLVVAPSMGPFIAELLAEGQLKRLQRILRGFASLIFLPTLLLAAVFLLVPELVLSLTFGPDFVEAAPILRVLVIGTSVFVWSGVNSQTLIMAGQQHALMVYSVGGLIGYIFLAPPLIMLYGTLGAATAMSLVLAIQSTIGTFLAKRRVGVWTMASLSPDSIRSSLRMLRGRR
jgi:O-antigen/teichoic acid export membrane protein